VGVVRGIFECEGGLSTKNLSSGVVAQWRSHHIQTCWAGISAMVSSAPFAFATRRIVHRRV
jgi:hypothetical protein